MIIRIRSKSSLQKEGLISGVMWLEAEERVCYVYIENIHIQIHIHIHVHKLTNTNVYTFIHTYRGVHLLRKHAYRYIIKSKSTCIHVHAYTCINIIIHLYTHTCTTYANTCLNIHINTGSQVGLRKHHYE